MGISFSRPLVLNHSATGTRRHRTRFLALLFFHFHNFDPAEFLGRLFKRYIVFLRHCGRLCGCWAFRAPIFAKAYVVAMVMDHEKEISTIKNSIRPNEGPNCVRERLSSQADRTGEWTSGAPGGTS